MNDLEVAIEAKGTEKITSDHLRGLRELYRDHPRAGRRIMVCLETRRRRTDDGIDILPAAEVCRQLAAGEVF